MSFPSQEGRLPHMYAIKLYFCVVLPFFFLLIQTFVHFLTKLQVTTTLLKSFLVGKYCKIFVCNYHVFTGPRVSDFQ